MPKATTAGASKTSDGPTPTRHGPPRIATRIANSNNTTAISEASPAYTSRPPRIARTCPSHRNTGVAPWNQYSGAYHAAYVTGNGLAYAKMGGTSNNC